MQGEYEYNRIFNLGYVDDAFAKESSYTKQRETELEVLTDPSIKLAIQASNSELITFAELQKYLLLFILHLSSFRRNTCHILTILFHN